MSGKDEKETGDREMVSGGNVYAVPAEYFEQHHTAQEWAKILRSCPIVRAIERPADEDGAAE